MFFSLASDASKRAMKLQRRNESMVTQGCDCVKIGDVQLWMEDDSVKLSTADGISCSLSAEEAWEVLDLLSHHQEDIDQTTAYQEESDDAEEDYTGGWLHVGR
jgi:hypothetical protein